MESDIITVNLERRDKISTKDLFSDIQVIPLETTPESLIRDITQIKFFEDRYYIHDYRRSQIFVFDREGRFQFALNEKGDFRILLEPTNLSSSKTRIRSLSSPMIMTIA